MWVMYCNISVCELGIWCWPFAQKRKMRYLCGTMVWQEASKMTLCMASRLRKKLNETLINEGMISITISSLFECYMIAV